MINTSSIKVALHHGDKVRLKQIQNYWCVYKALRALISPFRSSSSFFFLSLFLSSTPSNTNILRDSCTSGPGKRNGNRWPFLFPFLSVSGGRLCTLFCSEREHSLWLLGGMGSEQRVDPAETDQRRLSQSGRVQEHRHTHTHTHRFHLCHSSHSLFLAFVSFTFHCGFVES